MGLYGNVFGDNIIYNINLESSSEELSNILESVNLEYITEGVNIKEVLNKAINKLKELWNKFKTWAKDIIKKVREFIKKALSSNKNQSKKDNTKDDDFMDQLRGEEYHIKYYEFSLDNIIGASFADWASQSTSYSAYTTWLRGSYYKKYRDINISELDQWLEEKKNKCIELSDEKFKEFKDKNTLSEDSFELIERYITPKYFSDYIKYINNSNKNFNKYIVNANKGLDNVETKIKENEDTIDKLNKHISLYTNSVFKDYEDVKRDIKSYLTEIKLIQHDIPQMKEAILLFVNNTRLVQSKFMFNKAALEKLEALSKVNPRDFIDNTPKLNANNPIDA